MIRINLLPPEERPASRRVRVPRSPALLAIGLFALMAAPIAVTTVQQNVMAKSLKSAIVDAKAEQARLKPEIERLHQLQQQTRELNHRIGVVAKLDAASTYYVEVLDCISQILPQHMWLSALTEDPNRPGIATIEGYSFTNLQVADLMVRLEKIGLFSDVVLVRIERKPVEGREVLNFHLEVRLTYRTHQGGEPNEHP